MGFGSCADRGRARRMSCGVLRGPDPEEPPAVLRKSLVVSVDAVAGARVVTAEGRLGQTLLTGVVSLIIA